MNDVLKVKDDQIVTLDYTLRVNGEVVDSSEGHAPIEFIQGMGHIIPGLEGQLYGMGIGESKSLTVLAADGYGEIDPNAVVDIPRAEFPPRIQLEAGLGIQMTDPAGNPMTARIDSVAEDTVTLDFNHPLAGKELLFDVKIVGLREATAEEMDHGHVHDHGHTH
jgi:FKBP-type peptidyl-prolyl cis-trans isomerase SlyD